MRGYDGARLTPRAIGLLCLLALVVGMITADATIYGPTDSLQRCGIHGVKDATPC